MESIKWTCRKKTINNNIVWLCDQNQKVLEKIKEHFQSSSPGSLQGNTKLPSPVNITLGPANFGPSEIFCRDTTGYTKLGEWNLRLDNTPQHGGRLNNGDIWNIRSSVGANGDWSGANLLNGGRWNDWLGFSIVDANNVNTQPAFFDIYSSQEFTQRWFVLLRNKSNPNSYYLFSKVAINSFRYINNADSDTYLVYTNDNPDPNNKTIHYDNLNIPMEKFFNGQSGGTPINNSIYEIFLKPFIRPTYPIEAESNITPIPTLSSDFFSKLFLWFDANDPNADGTNTFNNNDDINYWNDKSVNKIKMIRGNNSTMDRWSSDINTGKSGDIGRNASRIRLAKIKTKFKNGLSVIRFNGTNWFNGMSFNDPNTKILQEKKSRLANYTIVLVHYLTESGGSYASNTLFSIGGERDIELHIGFNNFERGGPTLAISDWNQNRSAIYPVDLLNKWAITTITKNNVIQTHINGTLVNPGFYRDGLPFNSDHCVVTGSLFLSFGAINNQQEGGDGFKGDLAEIMFFNNPLNDDERQKVEGHLAKKWNLVSLLPDSNNYTTDPNSSAQLFLKTNYEGTSAYFSVGKYSSSKLKTIGPKALQSIKVPNGYEAVLYQNIDFTGYATSITSDVPDLSTIKDSLNTNFSWNIQMQSLIVRKYIPPPTNIIDAQFTEVKFLSKDNKEGLLATLPAVKIIALDPNSSQNVLLGDPNNINSVYWYRSPDLQFSAPFNPKKISNLQIWLDGADPLGNGQPPKNNTVINTWFDKSGKGNNLKAQKTATYTTSSKSLNFNRSLYNSIDTLVYPTDTYIIVRVNDTNGPFDICSLAPNGLDDFNSLTFGEYTRGRWHNGSSGFSRTPNAIAPSNETSTDFLIMRWSLADNNFSIGRNGEQIVFTNSYTWNKNPKYFQLGSRFYNDAGNNLVGNIAEVVVFNKILSNTERQSIEGYLAWKWGLQSKLPGHPYASIPRKPFDLSSMGRLQLWLDSNDSSTLTLSGSNVSQWNDKSGNGNNFTVTPNFQPPTFKDANSGISFVANQVMISAKSVTTNNNTTIFFVGNVINNKDDFDYIVAFTQQDLAFRWNPRNKFGDNSNGDFSLDSGYIINGRNATTDFTKRTLVNFVVQNGGSGQLTLSTDRNFGSDRFFKGVMCELLIFNTPLTPVQIQEIQGYLATKWGLQSNLPNHLYYSKPPTKTPFNLNLITSAKLWVWLDANDINGDGSSLANGTEITTWKNKTIYSSDATKVGGSSPQVLANNLNGKSVLDLRSNTQFAFSFGTNLRNYTIFTVQFGKENNDYQRLLNGGSKTKDSLPLWGFDKDNSWLAWFGSTTSTNPSQYSNNKWSMADVVFNNSGNVTTLSFNGTPLNQKNGSNVLIDGMLIGSHAGNGGQFWKGLVAEIIIFNGLIDDEEREMVQGYLASKWGLTANLPDSHPYKKNFI